MSRGQHILSVSWLPFHHEDIVYPLKRASPFGLPEVPPLRGGRAKIKGPHYYRVRKAGLEPTSVHYPKVVRYQLRDFLAVVLLCALASHV